MRVLREGWSSSRTIVAFARPLAITVMGFDNAASEMYAFARSHISFTIISNNRVAHGPSQA